MADVQEEDMVLSSFGRGRILYVLPLYSDIHLLIYLTVEFAGYAARTKSASEEAGHNRLMPYIIQSTYILLAPALFAATIYMTLGRVIKLIDGDQHSIISGQKLTLIFLLGDVFCFVMQSVGTSLISSHTSVGT
jgi:hypothetical protein